MLRDRDVRAALSASIDRETLVDQVLRGYGTAVSGPTPVAAPVPQEGDLIAAARDRLFQKGWKLNEEGVLVKTTGSGKTAKTATLSFSLATGNVPELRAAAELLKLAWEEMGARVSLQIYEQGDLSQNVIRPRKYDALLFGEVVGRELDLYAFWHSSQRNDPGLNIALYANATADKALTDLRATSDAEERAVLLRKFQAELEKDIPAVFLYAPDFVYIVPNDIQGLELGFIEAQSDRFLSVSEWHREKDRVWPIFSGPKQ